MKIYLVQHGESAPKDVIPDRPLTQAGQEDVRHIAAALGRAEVKVDRLIHSGKLRALQTAEILAAEVAPGLEPGISDQINPLDEPAGFDWQGTCAGNDTMLVGHLPFMAKLVSYLVTGAENQTLVAYQPGSIVCLESDDDGGWQIDWMLRPELLT